MATLAACSSRSLEAHDAGGTDTPATMDAADAAAGSKELVYVANYLSGISAFAIQDSGDLVALSDAPFVSERRFYGMALHPSRPILYAAEYTGHAVDAYQIEPDTGALLPIGEPVALDHPAVSIAVDPQGRFVYAADFDDVDFTNHAIHTFAIDASGALSSRPVSSLTRQNEVSVIAPDPSGHFVYTTDGELGIAAFAVDGAGALSELMTSPFAGNTVRGGWLAFHPSVRIVYNARWAFAALALEPTTGALNQVSGSPFAVGAGADLGAIAVAVDPRGRFVCAVDMTAGTVNVYAIHADGSIAIPGSSYAAGSSAYSVAIDPDGRFVYVATDFGNIAAFSIDPATFALTPLTHSPFVSVVGNQPEMVMFRTHTATQM